MNNFNPQGILFIAAVLNVDVVISSCRPTENRYGLVLDRGRVGQGQGQGRAGKGMIYDMYTI